MADCAQDRRVSRTLSGATAVKGHVALWPPKQLGLTANPLRDHQDDDPHLARGEFEVPVAMEPVRQRADYMVRSTAQGKRGASPKALREGRSRRARPNDWTLDTQGHNSPSRDCKAA